MPARRAIPAPTTPEQPAPARQAYSGVSTAHPPPPAAAIVGGGALGGGVAGAAVGPSSPPQPLIIRNPANVAASQVRFIISSVTPNGRCSLMLFSDRRAIRTSLSVKILLRPPAVPPATRCPHPDRVESPSRIRGARNTRTRFTYSSNCVRARTSTTGETCCRGRNPLSANWISMAISTSRCGGGASIRTSVAATEVPREFDSRSANSVLHPTRNENGRRAR